MTSSKAKRLRVLISIEKCIAPNVLERLQHSNRIFRLFRKDFYPRKAA